MSGRPEDIVPFVYYENPLAGSIYDDVMAIGERGGPALEGLQAILEHIARVHCGKEQYARLKVWHFYRGVPLFKPEVNGVVMIYAVENLADKARPVLKVTLLFAAMRVEGYNGIDGTWDGSDDDALWHGIITTRCGFQFQ